MENLEYLWYFIVGLVQGVSEPFPVSSSAQTMIATKLTKLAKHSKLIQSSKGEAAFDIWLNLGSAIAITLIMMPVIKKVISGTLGYFNDKNNEENKEAFNITVNLVITTAITIVLGLILKSALEDFLKSRYILIVIGLVLFFVMIPIVLTINYLSGNKKVKEITYLDSVLFGVLQSLALIPGLSRSGLTLLGLKSRNFSIVSAIKFSFLMYIPVSYLSVVKSFLDTDISTLFSPQFMLAAVAAFIGTYAMFNVMVSMAKRKTLKYVSSWLALSSVLAIASFLV